jgi:hypothetical protein
MMSEPTGRFNEDDALSRASRGSGPPTTDAQKQAEAIAKAGKRIAEGLHAVAAAIDRLALSTTAGSSAGLAGLIPSLDNSTAPINIRDAPSRDEGQAEVKADVGDGAAIQRDEDQYHAHWDEQDKAAVEELEKRGEQAGQ